MALIVGLNITGDLCRIDDVVCRPARPARPARPLRVVGDDLCRIDDVVRRTRVVMRVWSM